MSKIRSHTSQSLFKDFLESEKSGGLVLIACTLLSLVLANSPIGESYLGMWQTKWLGLSVEHWVNDALMAIFFLLIGLELEREVYVGELSRLKDALLPMFAALGGVMVPAGLYLSLNYGTPAQSGAGITMATDIAFALGVLSLLGSRVPVSLKIFLTALAVIDDLCAILIIAIFYTKTIFWGNLAIALGLFAILLVFNRLQIKRLSVYLVGGALMWFFMLQSGVHATITGVLLAFTIPFGKGDQEENSISYKLQHVLHQPVAFIILPIFALANTAIVLSGDLGQTLSQSHSVGIMLGLVVGKPLGIFLMAYLAVRFGLCSLPSDLNWKAIFGAGLLGGIGFTMSIFITLLAFDDVAMINDAKLSILLASLIAGVFGFLMLHRLFRRSA